MMLQHILKPFYWSVDRKVRQLPSIAIILGFTLPLYLLERLLTREDVISMVSSVPLLLALMAGVTVAAVLMMLDINHTLYQLFESAELPILMVNPVPLRTIYLLKLFQSARTLLLPGFSLLLVFGMMGIGRGAGLGFYLLAVLLVVGSMVTVATAVFSMVLLICRVIPPRYLRAVILLLFTLLPIGVIFVQTNLMTVVSAQSAILTRLSVKLPLLAGVTGTTSIIMAGVSWRIFTSTFYEGRVRFNTAPPPREQVPSQGWLAKEWAVLRRDVRLLIGFLQPLAFLVLLLLPLWQGVSLSDGFTDLLFWFTFVVATQLIMTTPLLGGRVLANEGRAVGLLRTAPVDLTAMLRAKLMIVGVPAFGIWVASVLLLMLLYGFALWQVGLLLSVSLIGGGFALVTTMGLSALYVDFSTERIPIGVQVGAFLLNGVWAGTGLTCAAWVAWHLADARTLLMVLNLTPPLFLWLPLFGIVGVLAAFSISFWRRGGKRLNTLDMYV